MPVIVGDDVYFLQDYIATLANGRTYKRYIAGSTYTADAKNIDFLDAAVTAGKGYVTGGAADATVHTLLALDDGPKSYVGAAGYTVAVNPTEDGFEFIPPASGGSSGPMGDVVGPMSATDGDFAQFDGASGALIKDGGLSLDTDGTLAANSDSKIPSQKAVKTYVDAQVGGASSLSPYSYSVTKPVAANFTTVNSTDVNHGTVTLTDLATRGVLMDNVLANTGVLTQGFSYKAAVSNTLVAVTAFFHQVWDIGGSWFFGVAVRDNAGKIHAWGYRDSQFSEFKYTDINTLSSQTNYGSINTAFYRLPLWVRIVKSGSNFELSYSLNGETWILVATVSATSFVGATLNDVGIFLINNVASTTNHMKVACYSFAHS